MAHLEHDPYTQPDGRTTLQLGAVLPATAEVRENHLFVGGVDMVALARNEGTALYVMDVAHIKQQLHAYREALGKNNLVAFAGKAFLNKALARLLQAEGVYLDVSGGGELAIACAAGFDPQHVIVHGNNKTNTELDEALEAGVGLIVVDCFEELERLSLKAQERAMQQRILLRIKPGVVAKTHEFIRTGAEDSKFGFGVNDGWAKEAVARALDLPGVALAGLHVHIGSQIFDISAYQETIDIVMEFVVDLRAAYGFVPEIIDVGGGLGIAYQAEDAPASIEELGQQLIQQILQATRANSIPQPTLIVEPGRSVVANAGVTLYTVGAIKDLEGVRCYVAVDGGMTDNIRTALYDARYEAVIANKAEEPRTDVVTLAGKHCESGDIIAIDASLQSPEVGDIIAVCGTGAYNASMSSNYNAQVRPAVVFVEDGVASVVQRRETYADLMARDRD